MRSQTLAVPGLSQDFDSLSNWGRGSARQKRSQALTLKTMQSPFRWVSYLVSTWQKYHLHSIWHSCFVSFALTYHSDNLILRVRIIMHHSLQTEERAPLLTESTDITMEPKEDGAQINERRMFPPSSKHRYDISTPPQHYEVCPSLTTTCSYKKYVIIVYHYFQSLDYDICYNVPYKENLREYTRFVS